MYSEFDPFMKVREQLPLSISLLQCQFPTVIDTWALDSIQCWRSSSTVCCFFRLGLGLRPIKTINRSSRENLQRKLAWPVCSVTCQTMSCEESKVFFYRGLSHRLITFILSSHRPDVSVYISRYSPRTQTKKPVSMQKSVGSQYRSFRSV